MQGSGDEGVERCRVAGAHAGWGEWRALAGVAAALCVAGAGCREDTRLTGREIPHVTVRTVTDDNVVLDQSASPKQVAYVLLKAVRDDVRASTRQDRDRHLNRQLDLCAPDTIFGRYRELHRRNAPQYQADRDETIYRVVDSWAPTLAQYVDNFDFEWPEAEKELVLRDARKLSEDGPDEKHVLLEVGDPGGDPNASAVAQITLVKEGGFWRVFNVGFLPGRRHLGQETPTPTSAPTAAAQTG